MTDLEQPGRMAQAPEAQRVWTLGEVLTWSTAFLKEKGAAAARLDAELLLAYVLSCSRIQLYTGYEKPLQMAERDALKTLLRRRAGGEPTAYILGLKEFMGHSFKVCSDVLIPRPETELLCELVMESYAQDAPISILDIGSGSGCIAVSLAHYFSASTVEAWEISAAAAKVSRENVESLLQRPVTIELCDATSSASWEGKGPYDLIVSNPPYIAEGDPDLAADVERFEPRLALFADDAGMKVYKAIADLAPASMAPEGKVFVEIGWKLADDVVRVFRERGFRDVQVHKDFAQRDRVVVARAPKGEL